jgi:hypothetical protein
MLCDVARPLTLRDRFARGPKTHVLTLLRTTNSGRAKLTPAGNQKMKAGNFVPHPAFSCRHIGRRTNMGRAALLWLIGIPLPIILIIWLLGGLHG